MPELDEIQAVIETGNSENNSQKTSKIACDALVKRSEGYIQPTKKQRKDVLVAFAREGKPVYGRAFDLLKFHGIPQPSLEALTEKYLQDNIAKLTLYEVKSTNRKNVKEGFKGYFFSLSTAELLVAQALGENYKFILYNLTTKEIKVLSLREIYGLATAIYPTWSVKL